MTLRHYSFRSKAADAEIHRITAHDENWSREKSRGTILALHGLGDHTLCHAKAFEIFSGHGYRVEGFDWPGNGDSEGKKGDIPGVKTAIRLLQEIVASLESPPVAVYAHSTGCFLAMPFLDRYAAKLPIEWVWLSSPLLRPSHGQPKLKIQLSEVLAEWMPKLTVSTGVSPSRCYHVDNRNETMEASEDSSSKRHTRISLRFGRELLRWEGRVWRSSRCLSDPIRVLLTQGLDDTICRPSHAKEFFKTIPASNKTLSLLEGIRHEPLWEPDNAEFLDIIEQWLRS